MGENACAARGMYWFISVDVVRSPITGEYVALGMSVDGGNW